MRADCKFCGAYFHTTTKDVECPSCGNCHEKRFTFSVNDSIPMDAIRKMAVMMYEVEYEFRYGDSRIEKEIGQISETRLNRIKKYEEEGKYYRNVTVIRELGVRDVTWIPTWLEIGRENYWIGRSWDPIFDHTSFAECKTVEYLIQQLARGNQSCGTAYYYKDMCFINQVNGGHEWLVIRRDIAFESYSGWAIKDKPEKFATVLEGMFQATDEQLRNLKYMDAI